MTNMANVTIRKMRKVIVAEVGGKVLCRKFLI